MLPPPTLRRRRGASTDRIVLLKFPYEMQALTAGVSAGLGIFSLGMSGIAGGMATASGKSTGLGILSLRVFGIVAWIAASGAQW